MGKLTSENTRPDILDHVESLGHKVFASSPGTHNGNLIVERRAFDPDFFRCTVHWLERHIGGGWLHRSWACSSWPSLEALDDPVHSSGTPIIVPGQYPSLWEEGWHPGPEGHGRRRAFTQTGKGAGDLLVRRLRSSNELEEWERLPLLTAPWRGLNLHDAKARRGRFTSLGCITVEGRAVLGEILCLYRRGVPTYGRNITLTLVDAP